MARKPHLLVVDDDVRLCRTLQRSLSAAGFQVDYVHDGDEMFVRVERNAPDLVLLDLNLPDTHGFDLAKRLRQNSNVGIIILTGSHDRVDKVVGLELGADDYVEKPFEERELLARIRSVLRRVNQGGDPQGAGEHATARFADFRVDLVAHELKDASGDAIHLTSHEYLLLTLFLENSGRVMTRDQILDKVYGREWYQSDRSVDILVGKLRKKLGDRGDDPQIVKTMRGVGYIMTTRVDFD